MESLVYTHLALAYEDTSTLELSNLQVFDVLIKLNLLALLKQQKSICKAWIYGLSLSLTFIPLSDTLTLHLAEHRKQVSSLLFQPTSEAMLAQSPSSLSLEGKGEIQPSSISSPRNEEQGKVLFAKGGEETVNRTYPVNTTAYLQTHSGVELVQYAENKAPVSNPNSKVEPKKVSSNKLLISKPEPISKTQPEQKGKLRLVNDSPYTAIVFLYRPGEQQPYRYANIPACHQRELLATYSNLWQISFNKLTKSSISDVSVKEGEFFEIKASKLAEKENWINSCQDSPISRPVVDIGLGLSDSEKSYLHEQIRQIQKSDLPKNQFILIASANLMEISIEKMIPMINITYQKKKPSDLSNDDKKLENKDALTEYCILNSFLRKMAGFYYTTTKPPYNEQNRNTNNFKLDLQAQKDEIDKLKDYDPYKKDLIILVEVYLQAQEIYNMNVKSLGPTPGSSSEPINGNKSANNDICRARLVHGNIAYSYNSLTTKRTKLC